MKVKTIFFKPKEEKKQYFIKNHVYNIGGSRFPKHVEKILTIKEKVKY